MEEGKRKARGRREMPDSGTKMQCVMADYRRMDVREMGKKGGQEGIKTKGGCVT